ncbi:Fic family protein [Brevibacterium luteolum]|uniref:Fic family protein n=1 Tax=Brevibacterium luteolum TaxID=199591 RepID=UPI0020B4571A|nr:Fic family protein [Brevibacterium luteolum]
MPSYADMVIPVEPVSSETLDWVPRALGLHSRAEVRRQTGPYEAAIPAAIASWAPQITGEMTADIEDATRQLVEFDAHAQKRLGAHSPALGPMTAILLRTESALSSQIEQLTTSAKQLALAEIHEGDKPNALTVLGNVHAMESALQLTGDITAESILGMHAELMRDQHGLEPAAAGCLRDQQVWIGRGDAGPRIADFVAPHHDRVPAAIDDLVAFMKRQDFPVLAHAAVAHAQFETIHPFTDGNGRTGRALIHAMLRRACLVRSTAVPVSAGLLTDIDLYFAALDAYRRGDAGPIIRAFTQAARTAAVTAAELVDSLTVELEHSRSRLTGLRADAAAWTALPVLIGQPVVNTRYLTTQLGMGEMTALRALATLTERGVLTEITGRARGRVWQHRGILDVLDDYAATIRRMASR